MQRGANMDLRDPEGNTAAHWAFAMGFNDLADFILAKGANDRIANNQGFTCRNWRRPEPCDGRSYTVAVGVPLVEPGPGWGAPRKPVPQEGLGPCEKDAQASVTRVSSRSAHSPQNEALQDPLATLRARVSELEESNARLEKANHLVQQEKQIVQTEKDELARHNTELQSKLSALVCIPMKPKNYGVCGTVHVSLTGVKFENTCTPEYLRRDVACLLGRHRGYVCMRACVLT